MLFEVLVDKYCFVYCGPERCNCKRGHIDVFRKYRWQVPKTEVIELPQEEAE